MAQPKETKTKVKAKKPVGLNGVSPRLRKHPGITKTPGVCGGAACIKKLRMPVWVLYRARLNGVSEDGLLECYPFLKRAELKDAWRYVKDHPKEIEKKIKENSW
jgi:uncharacterized protein (DUF433 family)